ALAASAAIAVTQLRSTNGAAHAVDESGGSAMSTGSQSLVLGGGCFWCIEAIFKAFRGVESVESGFAGGHLKNPSYEDVVTGQTGHAEVVRVVFDPSQISTEQLLTIFFHAHDPTTRNRQGNDVGPQYRSAVFYQSDEQKAAAEVVLARIVEQKLWGDK